MPICRSWFTHASPALETLIKAGWVIEVEPKTNPNIRTIWGAESSVHTEASFTFREHNQESDTMAKKPYPMKPKSKKGPKSGKPGC